MLKGIKDKRVLITGASGGIGSSMAYLFAEYGAIVGVHYNQSRNEADQIVRKIEKNGGRGASFQADLIADSPKDMIYSFIKMFGEMDVLINNAGAVIGPKSILEMDEESWNKTFLLNAQAPFFLAQSALSI